MGIYIVMSVQIVDKGGKYKEFKVSDIIGNSNLRVNDKVSVVSIIGPQSSGKSFIMKP
jgi:ABC-type polar amino acid transport system ATPase subunit